METLLPVGRTAGRPSRPTIWARWPQWVGGLTVVWSLAYGALGLCWALGGPAFPYGAEHDPGGRRVSLLDQARPESTGWVIAGLGIGGALLALSMTRGVRRQRARAVPLGVAWTFALGLAVVLPDYRPLLAIVRAPMLLAGAPFGWPEEIGLGDFLPTFLPWPVANQLLLIAGGLLWGATALTYRRAGVGACAHCGRTDHAAGWTTPVRAARWGRWAVAVAIVIPTLYALTRWAWALDIPLGASREGLRAEERESPGIWLAGAMIATLAVGGAVLTLGLVQRWGEIYPRWIPVLRGKPVRPRTAIVPASLVALLLGSAGLMEHRALIRGHLPASITGPDWGTVAPGQTWTLWGVALAAATLAYHLRRRGVCAHCARG